MVIQESAEDYLEKVLMLSKEKANVRQTDICDVTGYARPSVSVAIRKLASEGYLEISELGAITLTDKGHEIADRIYERHNVIASLLIAIGTDPDVAYEDACKVEHDFSEESFQNLKKYYEEKFKDK